MARGFVSDKQRKAVMAKLGSQGGRSTLRFKTRTSNNPTSSRRKRFKVIKPKKSGIFKKIRILNLKGILTDQEDIRKSRVNIFNDSRSELIKANKSQNKSVQKRGKIKVKIPERELQRPQINISKSQDVKRFKKLIDKVETDRRDLAMRARKNFETADKINTLVVKSS